MLEDEEKVREFREKINKVREYKDPYVVEKELRERLEKKEINLDEYTEEIKKLARFSREESFKDLKIKHLANHYYIPIVLSGKEKVDYIKHIIKTKSEVDFVKKLERHLASKNNGFEEFDWWMFSKIDEHLDEVYIPYYDPNNNVIRRFKPDFVFWLKRGNDYFVAFADPKGIQHMEFTHKVDGFKRIFGDITSPCVFKREQFRIRVLLFLFTKDKNRLSEGYRRYWHDNIDSILGTIQKISFHE